MMRDIPEFLHLKSFEEIFRELERDGVRKALSGESFKSFCETYAFTKEQSELLAVMLKEKGFKIE